MNKKVLIGAVTALFLGAGVFTATSLAQKEQISDLTLANIEAMTFMDFDIENPCHNANGYREILQSDIKVYDCCYQSQVGRGRTDCKRF